MRQYIDAMTRVPYSLKNCLVFGPYRPEKEIFYFNKNSKFRFQIDLDRHGPRPLLNDRYLEEPPPFSLYNVHYTFKTSFSGLCCIVYAVIPVET